MPREAAPTPGATSRFAYLDGLRGWAALLVVINHGTNALDYALETGRLSDSRNAWDVWLSGTPFLWFTSAGNFAVCIFFALSGFVLTHAYSRSRQGWIALAVRRYVRLGVPMLAGCLLGWVLLRLGWMRMDEAAAITYSSWLSGQYHQVADLLGALMEPVRLLLGRKLSSATSYDSSLWTMPVEAIGSLMLMTVFVPLRRTEANTGRLGGYAFGAFALLSAGSYFSLFAFGAALRLSNASGWLATLRRLPWTGVPLLLLGLFFGSLPSNVDGWAVYQQAAALAGHVPWPSRFWSHSPVSLCNGIGAALILLLVCSRPSIQGALSRPAGRFLGRISFPLYILHVPVLMVVECGAVVLLHRVGMAEPYASLVSLGVFIPAAVLVAAVLTPIVEGGAIRWSARIGEIVDGSVKRVAGRRLAVSRLPTGPN